MSLKNDLDAFVKRCAAVADGERELLEEWESDPGLQGGRRASCGVARRQIGDRRDEIGEVEESVTDLAEEAVTGSPAPAREQALSGAEDSLSARKTTRGAVMSDEEFGDALRTAEDNAQTAADAARAALADCTT